MKKFLCSFFILIISTESLCAYKRSHLAALQEQISSGLPISCKNFNLRNADLSGLNLEKADFSEANLKGATLSCANLRNAVFIGARLQKVNFSHADLTEVDFTQANVNGAKFKGAHLHGIKFLDMFSSKGTIFADEKTLAKVFKRDEEIETIRESFLSHQVKQHIGLRRGNETDQILDKRLKAAFETHHRYVVVDLRPLESSKVKSIIEDFPRDLSQEILRSLKANPFVRNTVSICDRKGLIVFLRYQDATDKEQVTVTTKAKLDLHGKIPVEVKYKWIDKFIKEAQSRHYPLVEVITGRGLHNPHGDLGVLWQLCKRYLLSRKFKGAIQGIQSIGQNGGWKVVLKNSKYVPSLRKKEPKFHKKLSLSSRTSD